MGCLTARPHDDIYVRLPDGRTVGYIAQEDGRMVAMPPTPADVLVRHGSVVRLKSGGPEMTARHVIDVRAYFRGFGANANEVASMARQLGYEHGVRCTWIDAAGNLQDGEFDTDLIEVVR